MLHVAFDGPFASQSAARSATSSVAVDLHMCLCCCHRVTLSPPSPLLLLPPRPRHLIPDVLTALAAIAPHSATGHKGVDEAAEINGVGCNCSERGQDVRDQVTGSGR